MDSIKSKVLRLAHQIVKRNNFSLSEAVKKAWQVIKLQTRLTSEKVSFTYRMLNGRICTVYGTLTGLEERTTSKEKRIQPIDQICYWDIFCNGFRSFVAGNLISINS